jgi:hypothetical protein
VISTNKIRLNSVNFYVALLLGLVVVQNLVASLWNVDPYHEGAIFATAVGMSDGLSVFREINQQYGFLGPLLVSFLLRIFGNYLIVERLFGFALIMTIAFLFFLNLRKITSKITSQLLAITWLAISPIWSWPFGYSALSGGYWPNHLGIALVLIGLLLLRKSKWFIFLAGFLVFISSQARIEFFFVWFFMTLAILLSKKVGRVYWLSGNLFAIIFIYLYLRSNLAIQDWFNQTLRVWTLDAPDVPKVSLNFFIFNFINFAGVCVIGLILFLAAVYSSTIFKKFWVAVIAESALILLLLYIPSVVTINLFIGNYDVFSAGRYFFANTLFSYVNISMLVMFVSTIFFIIKRWGRIYHDVVRGDPPLLILMATSFGLLALFHNFNPDYTQMVWPVFALLLIKLHKVQPNFLVKFIRSKALLVLTLSLIFSSSTAFISHALDQIYPYRTEMLKGLYGQSEKQVQELDRSYRLIEDNVSKGKMLMVCYTGLLSVNDQGYLGSDKWSWNLQPEVMISNRLDRLEINSTILACKLNNQDSADLSELEILNVVSIIAQNNYFTLYRVVKSWPLQ